MSMAIHDEMLALDSHEDMGQASPGGSAELDLMTMLSVIGTDVFTALTPPHDPRRVVGAAQLIEPRCTSEISRNAIVFAIGEFMTHTELEPFLSACAQAEAAAIVVRAPGDFLPWLKRRAAKLGLAVLELAPTVSWDRALGLCRAVLAASGHDSGLQPWDRAGADLYRLADTAAAVLGCSVDVTDHRLRIVAFSSLASEYDELRVDSILRRRVPDEIATWLRFPQNLSQLSRTTGPVRITPAGCRPRIALPVRCGTETVGYLWMLPTNAEAEEAVMRSPAGLSRMFANALTGFTLPDKRRRASALLRGVLEGSMDAAALMNVSFVAASDQLRVVGFRTHAAISPDHRALCDLAALVDMQMQPLGGEVIVSAIGDTVYALICDSAGGTKRLLPAVEGVVDRAGRRLSINLVAVVGNPIGNLSDLARARADVNRTLGVHCRGGDSDVIQLSELGLRGCLYELAEMAESNPHLLGDRPKAIADSDRRKNTDYIATLQAYFDANCDIADAANAMYLHRNTIRYRLQRIEEIWGLNLDDPVDRMVTELQLRLFTIRGMDNPDLPTNHSCRAPH